MEIKARVLCGASALTLAMAAGPALAQSGSAPSVAAAPAADSSQVGEVVVTALKRSVTLQNVPATVQVLSGVQLAQQGIVSLADMRNLIAGFEVSQSPNGTPQLQMRGLGTSTGSMAFEPSIGLFVDGAYLGHGRMYQSSLFDVDNVAFVEGTEAALLGKNTSLGAIDVTTKQPGKEFGYDFLASYEAELNSNIVAGGVNIPVNDTLRIRIAAQEDNQNGWVHDVFTGVDGPDRHNYGGRITAVWTPTDDFDLTASYTGTYGERQGMPDVTIRDWGSIAGGYFPFTIPGLLSPFGPAGVPGDTNLNYKNYTTDYNTFFGAGKEIDHGNLGVMTANYHTHNGLTLTSVSSFLSFDMNDIGSSSFTYWNGWDTRILESERQYSQEFRVTSPSDQWFEYIAGIYVSRDQWGQHLIYRGYGDNSSGPYSAANPPPPPSAAVAATMPPVTAEMFDRHDTGTNTAAAFANLTFNLTKQLALTVSGRVTNEQTDLTYSRVFAIGFPDAASPFANCLSGGPGILGGNFPTCATAGGGFMGTGTKSVTTDAFDPTIGLNYHLTHNILLYASYGQGTKGAGFANQTGEPGQEFRAEVARTAEIGVKSTFRDVSLGGVSLGDVRLNIAGFNTRLHNQQEAIFNGSTFVVANRNDETTGVDVDLSWQPTRELEVGVQTTYADTLNLASPLDPSVGPGTPVIAAPRWDGRVHATWNHDLGDNYRLSVEPAVDFRSSTILFDYTQGPLNCAPSPATFAYSCFFPRGAGYAKIDFRIGLANIAKNWEVAVIGRNLNDERIISFAYPQSNGTTQGMAEQPRTIAIQFSYKH
jgi:iron complex outermembrane recepter protein